MKRWFGYWCWPFSSWPAHSRRSAQQFPTRPITILIGLAAGGVSDTMARIYADAVSKTLGQRVVVENRATGSGAMAAAALQNALPDGHTLLIFSGAQHGVVPAIEKNAIYDPIKGNQPITLLFNTANVLVVPADSPVKSIAELVELGKKKAQGLTFGSPGIGSPSHLTGAKIVAATAMPAQFAHYRGGPPLVADLLPGRLDAAVISQVSPSPTCSTRSSRRSRSTRPSAGRSSRMFPRCANWAWAKPRSRAGTASQLRPERLRGSCRSCTTHSRPRRANPT